MEKEEMKHFYNTVELTHSELLEAQGRAISQEDRIYRFMKIMGLGWTAWELKEAPGFENFEITSIRRSLFNLEKQGKIQFSRFVPGPKGKPCGKYVAFSGLLF